MTNGEIEFIEDVHKLQYCDHNTEVSKIIKNKPNVGPTYLGDQNIHGLSTMFDNTNVILKKPNLSKWKPRKMSYHCDRQEPA